MLPFLSDSHTSPPAMTVGQPSTTISQQLPSSQPQSSQQQSSMTHSNNSEVNVNAMHDVVVSQSANVGLIPQGPHSTVAPMNDGTHMMNDLSNPSRDTTMGGPAPNSQAHGDYFMEFHHSNGMQCKQEGCYTALTLIVTILNF